MIQSVQKAMKILSVIADAKNNSISLMDIAGKTGYPKATCSHLLETLCIGGYVTRVSHKEGYILGPALYNLTRYGRYEKDFVSLCRPVMRWMEQKSHVTVILSVIRSNQKFIIDYADTEQKLFEEHPNIRTDDIYRTATGRAILSHMNRDEIREFWNKYGTPPPGHWDEITSYETLLQALNSIRQKMVVVSKGDKNIGEQKANGYACPLFRRSNCIGAIGLALKLTEEDEDFRQREQELCRILIKGAKEIQRRLNYEDQN